MRRTLLSGTVVVAALLSACGPGAGGAASGGGQDSAKPPVSASDSASGSVAPGTTEKAAGKDTGTTTAATPSPARPRTAIALLESISGTRGGHSVAYHLARLCPPDAESADSCTDTVPEEGTDDLLAIDDTKVADLQVRPLTEDFTAWYWQGSGHRVNITPAVLADADEHGGLGWDGELVPRPAVLLAFAPSGSIASIRGIATLQVESDLS
ncbi:hypothetical protein ACFCYX_24085 [Streptomyces populi]|uniref:hypothetical protein n=1 Tax=Streptomyces populi TaxID=2058924 RepID=UPI0035DFFF3F